MITIILFAVTVICLALVCKLKEDCHLLPPGPFQWPLFGNLLLFRRLSREHRGQHKAFVELSRQYSSNLVSLRLGKSDVLAVSGYDPINRVLMSEECDGRPWNEFIKMRNMGQRKGITMSDGPEWREVRAWFVRSLRQIGFGRAEMSAHMKEELQRILDDTQEGGIYSMMSLISPSIIKVISTVATGKSLKEAKLQQFLELMDRRTKVFDMAGGIISMFPWIRHIAPEVSGYNLLQAVNNELKHLLMEVIEDHKKNFVAGEMVGDLIDMFLQEMHDKNGSDSVFNEDQLFLILLDLFIAGSITTTATLDFLFLRMTVHQDIQKRLHEEIDSVIGHDRVPDLSDRPKLPFTEAVLTESQRIHMVTPIIGPRRVIREINIDGYKVSKNMTILLNVWSIHMNPEDYPNPYSFEPDRFFKNGLYVPAEKLIFFGRGHRRCPGEADARSALFLFFVGIMQRFQLLAVPGEDPPDVEPRVGLTMSPKPYKVLLVPRKRNSAASKLNADED